jgi:glycosyltransferase involved in cell wall biosynthesis
MDVVVGRAVRRAAAVLTVSEHVRDELARRYRIDGASVVVTPNAAPDAVRGEASTARFGLDGRYVLYVGNLYPYKNVTAVVDALARLPADCGDVTLVVVGALDEFAVPVRDAARAAGVEDRLVMTGHVSDAELASLYRGAALFVFPSLSEGFGLPGIEAMAHGVPVAAARASSLPETFGDAAAWFDPRDAGDIAVTLARLLRDPGERARLTTAGRRRVAALSWDRTAAATLTAYRRALGASPSAATAGPSS